MHKSIWKKNYLIKHLLEINKGKDCEEIFKAIQGKVYELSIHKFASNIIERCLYFGSKEQKNILIDEVLSKEDIAHDSIISLVKDKFGNYVVQKMIENSDSEKKDEIIKKIINSPLIYKKEGYTKHVINYISKLGYKLNNDNLNNTIGNKNKNNNKNVVNNNNLNLYRNLNNFNNINNINISNNESEEENFNNNLDDEDDEDEDDKDIDELNENLNVRNDASRNNNFVNNNNSNFSNINENFFNNMNFMNNKANYNVYLNNNNFQ